MSYAVKRPNRVLIGVIVAIAVLICGIGGAVLLFGSKIVDIGQASGELGSAEKAYRSAGLPWVANEVRKDLPIPAGKDAYPVVTNAIKLLKRHDYDKDIPLILKSVDFGPPEKARERLKPYVGVIDLAIEATRYPNIDYRRDYDLGPNLLLPEFASLKAIAKLTCYRAELEARAGDTQAAVRDLKASWHLGLLAAKDPILIGMLVAISIEAITCRSLQHCIYFERDNSNALEALSHVLDGATAPRFVDAMRAEAFMGVAAIRNLHAFGGIEGLSGLSDGESKLPRIDPKTLVRSGLPDDAMSRAFMARHLQVWSEFAKMTVQAAGDDRKLSRSMDRLIEKIEQRKSVSNILNEILFPVFGQAGDAVVKEQAEIIASRALLVAARARAVTGKIPSTIADIPGKWIDPFNGLPMHVRRDGQQFRVYSVGPNLKDDGGVLRSELKDKSSDTYDVVVQLAPPALPTPPVAKSGRS